MKNSQIWLFLSQKNKIKLRDEFKIVPSQSVKVQNNVIVDFGFSAQDLDNLETKSFEEALKEDALDIYKKQYGKKTKNEAPKSNTEEVVQQSNGGGCDGDKDRNSEQQDDKKDKDGKQGINKRGSKKSSQRSKVSKGEPIMEDNKKADENKS